MPADPTCAGKGHLQANDYYLETLVINKYPMLKIDIDKDTGEEFLQLSESSDQIKIEIDALINPDGLIEPSATYYLYYKKKNDRLKDTKPIAKALLYYFRCLREWNIRYDYFPIEEEYRPTYRFSNYLKQCIANKEIKLSLSTATTRIRYILAFYSFLYTEQIISHDEFDKAFKREIATIRINNKDTDMLSHISAINHSNERKVNTSDILRSFPPRQHKDPEDHLKSMSPEHLALFFKHMDELSQEKRLMLEFSVTCGTRKTETATTPERIIFKPQNDLPVKIRMSPLEDGWMTKKSKENGEIEIPKELMDKLYIYTLSVHFIKRKNRGLGDGRLFLNRDGKPFDENTVETFFAGYRKKLRAIDSTWNYRLHDLRCTFAMCKYGELVEKHGYITAGKILQALMRHNDFSSTLKYIRYFEKNAELKKHALALNEILKNAIGSN